jgi:hypothetical protein
LSSFVTIAVTIDVATVVVVIIAIVVATVIVATNIVVANIIIITVGQPAWNGVGIQPGFLCGDTNEDIADGAVPYDFHFCKNVEVGGTYEVHWVFSTGGDEFLSDGLGGAFSRIRNPFIAVQSQTVQIVHYGPADDEELNMVDDEFLYGMRGAEVLLQFLSFSFPSFLFFVLSFVSCVSFLSFVSFLPSFLPSFLSLRSYSSLPSFLSSISILFLRSFSHSLLLYFLPAYPISSFSPFLPAFLPSFLPVFLYCLGRRFLCGFYHWA